MLFLWLGKLVVEWIPVFYSYIRRSVQSMIQRPVALTSLVFLHKIVGYELIEFQEFKFSKLKLDYIYFVLLTQILMSKMRNAINIQSKKAIGYLDGYFDTLYTKNNHQSMFIHW